MTIALADVLPVAIKQGEKPEGCCPDPVDRLLSLDWQVVLVAAEYTQQFFLEAVQYCSLFSMPVFVTKTPLLSVYRQCSLRDVQRGPFPFYDANKLGGRPAQEQGCHKQA